MAPKGLPTSVTSPEFRISYPNVFQPRLNELSKAMEYNIEALFAKGADLTKMKEAAKNAMINKFGPDETKWPKVNRSPFKDQKEKAKGGALPEGLEAGAIFMRFKCDATKSRPAIVDLNKQEIVDPSKFYAGGYARASLNAYAFQKGENVGVAFGLNALQFTRDGEPLSGRPSVETAFEPMAGVASNDAASIF